MSEQVTRHQEVAEQQAQAVVCRAYLPKTNPDGTPIAGLSPNLMLPCGNCGLAFTAHAPAPTNRVNTPLGAYIEVVAIDIPHGHGQPEVAGVGSVMNAALPEYVVFTGDFNGMAVARAILEREGAKGPLLMKVSEADIVWRGILLPRLSTYVGRTLTPDPRRAPLLHEGQGVVVVDEQIGRKVTLVRDPSDHRWDNTLLPDVDWPPETRIIDVSNTDVMLHKNWRDGFR